MRISDWSSDVCSSDLNRLIQINLVGTFRCVAKSAAGMLTLDPGTDGERGAIVMTASVAAEDGQIGQAAYSASKGGVVGMTLPIARSEEHTSELQSLMRISYAVFCLKKKTRTTRTQSHTQ